MNLKERLLAAFVSGADKNSFYELGKQYSKECTSLGFFDMSGMKSVMKSLFGACCKQYGENLFEQGVNPNPEKLCSQFTSEYFKFCQEFHTGLMAGMQELGTSFAENCTKFFFNPFNMQAPENKYAEQFERLIDRKDTAGILEFYSQHKTEIDEKHPDAAELISFLEQIIKKE